MRKWIIPIVLLFSQGLLYITFSCRKEEPNIKYGSVEDIEGNSYKTIKIGNQTWMAQNLEVTKFNTGTAIPMISDGTTWKELKTFAFCWFENDPEYKNSYGALYNWYAVETGRLCPSGWHVPTDEEWTILTDYLTANGYGYQGSGDDIAKSMAASRDWPVSAEPGTPGNDQPNNNSSGFSAFSSPYRTASGTFYGLGGIIWWSATSLDDIYAYGRRIRYNISIVRDDIDYYKNAGYSVRCVKDMVSP